MRSMIHRLFRVVSGGTQPREVALAITLGILAGFTTGWNLTLLAILALALLTNVSVEIFLGAWGAGLGLAWLLANVSERLGRFVLDQTPVGQLLASLEDARIVALLGWDEFALAGGVVIGMVLSLLFGHAGYRAMAAIRESRPAQVQARWLRPRGWFLAPCFTVLAAWVMWCVGGVLAERDLLGRLAEANGADVVADSVRLSLWTGQLEVNELRAADPRDLTRDRLRVARLRAQLEPASLLRGRL